MKRKLSDRDVSPVAPTSAKSTLLKSSSLPSWDSMNLDPRILQAILSQKFSAPTVVQAQTIPPALQGKDVLARSSTGSGKTAAYVIPMLHSLLSQMSSTTTAPLATPSSATSAASHAVFALILVPTRELASQVTRVVVQFAAHSGGVVRVENLTRKEDEDVLRSRLTSGRPDIVVATPGRAAGLVNAGVMELGLLKHIVVDEADLALSFGYEEDLVALGKEVPRAARLMMMSATLRTEEHALKGWLLDRQPEVVDVKEEEGKGGELSQYVVKCGEEEKFLLCYAIFMLKLIKGKTIVFVNGVDRCYKLKLFLEQFGIRSCVLNSELPVNSRIHVVEEFNKNVYNIIIASDENEVIGEEFTKDDKHADADTNREGQGTQQDIHPETSDPQAESTIPTTDNPEDDNMATTAPVPALASPEADAPPPKKKKKKKPKQAPSRDKDYGVARGIDFHNVACVLNFDLPRSSRSYTHRIGRTARAGKSGTALSFAIRGAQQGKHKTLSLPSTEHDETVLARIAASQARHGRQLLPFAFDMGKLDGFRYRVGDALRAVGAGKVREARVRELRRELLGSERLKRYFEENPRELKHLRHDAELRAARVQPHLRFVPEYLMPKGGRKAVEREMRDMEGGLGEKEKEKEKRRGGKFGGGKGRGSGGGKRGRVNPLQTFKGKGKRTDVEI